MIHDGSGQPVHSSPGPASRVGYSLGGHGRGKWGLQVFAAGSPGLCSKIGNGQGVVKSVRSSLVDRALPGNGHQPTARALLLPMALQHCMSPDPGGSAGPCKPEVTRESGLAKVHLLFLVELMGLVPLQHWMVSTQPARIHIGMKDRRL